MLTKEQIKMGMDTAYKVASSDLWKCACVYKKVGCALYDIDMNLVSTGRNVSLTGFSCAKLFDTKQGYVSGGLLKYSGISTEIEETVKVSPELLADVHSKWAEINEVHAAQVACDSHPQHMDWGYAFVTEKPCATCLKSLSSKGIQTVFFPKEAKINLWLNYAPLYINLYEVDTATWEAVACVN